MGLTLAKSETNRGQFWDLQRQRGKLTVANNLAVIKSGTNSGIGWDGTNSGLGCD